MSITGIALRGEGQAAGPERDHGRHRGAAAADRPRRLQRSHRGRPAGVRHRPAEPAGGGRDRRHGRVPVRDRRHGDDPAGQPRPGRLGGRRQLHHRRVVPLQCDDQAAEPMDRNDWRHDGGSRAARKSWNCWAQAAVGQVLRLEYVPPRPGEADAAATSVRTADQRAIITLSASDHPAAGGGEGGAEHREHRAAERRGGPAFPVGLFQVPGEGTAGPVQHPGREGGSGDLQPASGTKDLDVQDVLPGPPCGTRTAATDG
jgi:hypothetical protein